MKYVNINAYDDVFECHFAQMRVICKFMRSKLVEIIFVLIIFYFPYLCFDSEFALVYYQELIFLWFHFHVFTV